MSCQTGLTKDEQQLLSDFTARLAEATATLRDAWQHADLENAHAIEIAIAVLFHESHSMKRNQSTMRKILAHGHDRNDELITNVSCALLDLGAVESRLTNVMKCTGILREISSQIAEMAGVHTRANDRSLEQQTILIRETSKKIEADAEDCLSIFRETATAEVDPVDCQRVQGGQCKHPECIGYWHARLSVTP